MSRKIAVVVTDLMFESRIAALARQLGFEPAVASSADQLDGALEGADLAVVDLQAEGLDPMAAVAQAKASGTPVVAFGQHTKADLLRRAREAGADVAVPRSTFFEEFATLVRDLA